MEGIFGAVAGTVRVRVETVFWLADLRIYGSLMVRRNARIVAKFGVCGLIATGAAAAAAVAVCAVSVSVPHCSSRSLALRVCAPATTIRADSSTAAAAVLRCCVYDCKFFKSLSRIRCIFGDAFESILASRTA